MNESFKAFVKENWMLFAAVIYILLPIDFIPDFLPALGLTDDLGALVVALLVRYVQHRKTFGKTSNTKSKNNNSEGPFKSKTKIVDGELVEEK